MVVEYKEINDLILEKISDIWGEWVKKCIEINDKTFSLSALDGDSPAGFICVTSRALTYPLTNIQDAFIEVLGVQEKYRRRGIARHLINSAEEWATQKGYKQIRSHSDHLSPEAIQMWHSLNYGLCPANDWLEDKKIYWPGYYVAKILPNIK